jgi:hypothetical protein
VRSTEGLGKTVPDLPCFPRGRHFACLRILFLPNTGSTGPSYYLQRSACERKSARAVNCFCDIDFRSMGMERRTAGAFHTTGNIDIGVNWGPLGHACGRKGLEH